MSATGDAPPPYSTVVQQQQNDAYGSKEQPPPSYDQLGPQQATQTHSTVVLSQPGVVAPANGLQGYKFTENAATLNCPHCQALVTTTTERHCGLFVWLICGVLCLIGLAFPLIWLGCQFIPFCIPQLYNVSHTCPNCHRTLGLFTQGGM